MWNVRVNMPAHGVIADQLECLRRIRGNVFASLQMEAGILACDTNPVWWLPKQ